MASKKGTWDGAEAEGALCVDMLALCVLLVAVMAVGVKVLGVDVEKREEDVSLSRCRADVERGARTMRDREGKRDCI